MMSWTIAQIHESYRNMRFNLKAVREGAVETLRDTKPRDRDTDWWDLAATLKGDGVDLSGVLPYADVDSTRMHGSSIQHRGLYE